METLLNKIEAYGFECEGGPLASCQDWQRLRVSIAELEGQLEAMTNCAKNHDEARMKYLLRVAALERQLAELRAQPTAQQVESARDAELQQLRKISWLIGSIFVHGDFKAETFNERELEKLLRAQGTFWDSLEEFDAAPQPVAGQVGEPVSRVGNFGDSAQEQIARRVAEIPLPDYSHPQAAQAKGGDK